ncbi:MAG: RluA family pseudouridine synthase [Elusimicrobia bacterium]|nr:RluA family pseudouridine synthase [Elusimicrobiota bacterium]
MRNHVLVDAEGAEDKMETPPPLPPILYEDEALVVFDKPAGLVVHPAAGHQTGTLVDALRRYLPADSELHTADPDRLGLVHRLDRGTSGVLVVARTVAIKASLMRQFAERQVQKIYLALVMGRMTPDRGSIEGPVGRSPKDRVRMAVTSSGRSSETEFVVRERFPNAALLEVYPKTGRTHQIRVHLSGIHHPVVGDATYGGASAKWPRQWPPRPMLHAWRLEFLHPLTNKRVSVTAPIPDDFARTVQGFRAGSHS